MKPKMKIYLEFLLWEIVTVLFISHAPDYFWNPGQFDLAKDSFFELFAFGIFDIILLASGITILDQVSKPERNGSDEPWIR